MLRQRNHINIQKKKKGDKLYPKMNDHYKPWVPVLIINTTIQMSVYYRRKHYMLGLKCLFYNPATPANFLPIHSNILSYFSFINFIMRVFGFVFLVYHYLSCHNVGSCERGHLPAWDSATYDHPDHAEDPEGHTNNLNSNRSHSGKGQDGEKNQRLLPLFFSFLPSAQLVLFVFCNWECLFSLLMLNSTFNS